MSTSGTGPFAVRFFDAQFKRQVASGEFALNPFETLALGHVRGSVLDLGCGLGNLTLEAARRGCAVVAVDASPTAIERLRRCAAGAASSVEAIQADLESYAIVGRFDTVVAIGLLMFFDRVRALGLLEAIRAAVKPGGTAVVNTLIEGTTCTAMLDPARHCLFGCTEIEEAFSDWTLIESRVDRYPGPGGTEKVFSTVVAQRPHEPSVAPAGGAAPPRRSVLMHERALLRNWVDDARSRTLQLVADLSDEQLMGPKLDIVNPLRWEIGHVAWFQEHWVLGHAAGRMPLRSDGDALYDSAVIPHRARWDLPLPDRVETLRYLHEVRDHVLAWIDAPDFAERDVYFVRLSVLHEDMHGEAMIQTRQTFGYPPPLLGEGTSCPGVTADPEVLGDTSIPGGEFRVGAEQGIDAPAFVFDNEKWAHTVAVAPFAIARAAVSQGQFARFVEDDGYRRRELWTDRGWAWRASAGADGPAYWRRDGARWMRRHFDRWVPLEPELALVHVNAFEAEAYCRWAGRRLPTEAEWEVAATAEPDASGDALAPRKRPLPWTSRADEPPRPEHANLDGRVGGCASVNAFPAGDSAFRCRQLWGNVWEWTGTTFAPYPGFTADPYKEYSAPWFGTHRVLRGGGSWTRARLLRSTWRNFYTPERRDVFAGFRTCAPS